MIRSSPDKIIATLDGAFVRLPSHEVRLAPADASAWETFEPRLGGEQRFRPPRVRDLGGETGQPEQALAGEDQGRSGAGQGANRWCRGAAQVCEVANRREAEDGERRRDANARDETAGACSAPIGGKTHPLRMAR